MAGQYEAVYLLGTSIARPLISKVCLQVAREVGANAYAHGATGKGNDQCRFQLAAEALDPAIKVIAPWRMEKFQQVPGRTELIAYCNAEHPREGFRLNTAAMRTVAYQLRGRKLEDLKVNGVETVEFGMTVSPQKAPDRSARHHQFRKVFRRG
jgi:argininosuccinate synthase